MGVRIKPKKSVHATGYLKAVSQKFYALVGFSAILRRSGRAAGERGREHGPGAMTNSRRPEGPRRSRSPSGVSCLAESASLQPIQWARELKPLA